MGHCNYGVRCPYLHMHLTDNNDKEGYVGHTDEEDNGEA